MAVAATVIAVLPLLGPGGASGDPIGDKRAEARRVADQLGTLRRQESVLAEQFNQGRIALDQLNGLVGDNQQRLSGARRELARRTKDLGRYAVAAYARGGDDMFTLMLQSSGNDLGQREGLLSIAVGNKADLIDKVRAARADADAAATGLAQARDAAAKANDALNRKREAASAVVAQQQQIASRVQG
ncbi:MAG: hypothetical protein JWM05_2462, partial [Acidimicrobiales bacterium]|nr:hypothetical protein [Acidimicrobiales bacterium]